MRARQRRLLFDSFSAFPRLLYELEHSDYFSIHGGLHILVRLQKEDWEKLRDTTGIRKTKLGQIRIDANTVDIELILCKVVTALYGRGYEFFNPFISLVTLDKVKEFWLSSISI